MPGKTDGGVRKHGPTLADQLAHLHSRVLLVFDYEGCGDTSSPIAIADTLRLKLRRHWGTRADVVVVEPELEGWIWRARSQIQTELGLSPAELVNLLKIGGFAADSSQKPVPPKDALEHVLRSTNRPFSSDFHARVARSASLRTAGCGSPSFVQFVQTLQRWFP
jgi:hypothetical protein